MYALFMTTALTEFVEILVGGIQSLATGIATGVAGMASELFLKVNATTGAVEGLSIFGGIIAIFSGLALAVGITSKVFAWVTSLGN